VTVGVEIDADRIATAVRASRSIAGLDSGRYGEIATYLPGRRVSGVRIDLHIGDTDDGDIAAIPDGRAPDPTSPDRSSDPAVVVSACRVDHTVDRS
jgi:hypothetical protein